MEYIYIIFIIGFLILIHETGHFLAGMLMKIPMEQFSIGFGKALFRFRKWNTEFKLSVFPLGGYVLPALATEEDWYKIPVYKRFIFSIGGPAANLFFPLVMFAVLNTIKIGFSFTGIFVIPFLQVSDYIFAILASFATIFSHTDQLSGIVGIVFQGAQFAGTNYIKLIQISIIISLNLAVFNLLPFPMLDGGKIIFFLLEKINPKLNKLQYPFTLAGLVLLIMLMLYTTIIDITKLLV